MKSCSKMAHHWEILKCRQQDFNCSRETLLLSRTRATGLKHSHHNLYCFIFVKPLTTGGPQMCHSSGSWREIQSPHQNLIYDQPVGRRQGNQGCTGGWGKPCVDRAQPKPLHKHTWKEPPLPSGNFCTWKFLHLKAAEPQHPPALTSRFSCLGSTKMKSKGSCAEGRTGSLQATAHFLKSSGKSRAGMGRGE